MNKTLNARLFVEKKAGFQVEAQDLLDDLNHNLELKINKLRLIVVYDIFGIEEELLEKAKKAVFSEPVTDEVYTEFPLDGLTYFAVEFLPGQFDQRADSAMQCPTKLARRRKPWRRRGKSAFLMRAARPLPTLPMA